MPITHGSNCAIVFINCMRRTSRRSTTFPAQSTPCNWNRFFAKSTPKVVILFTDPSPLRYESIRHTFILAHYVTPLKWGWVHSISLGRIGSGSHRLDRQSFGSQDPLPLLDTLLCHDARN